MNYDDFKSDRINFEVTLYKGCTLHELMALAGFSFGICIISATFLFSFLWQAPLIGIAFGIPVSFVVMLIIATSLGKIKQNKPQGYYQQQIRLCLEDQGLLKTPFVRRSGKWSVRRMPL